ncbi:MAG TPA: cupin domain-containing protein [Burkholderiales bacterium]|nr:cupin domain-containing protein [Burkholderiales bacterium]
MTEKPRWKTDGVKVVRAESLQATMREPSRKGRATAFDFAGSGGQKTWIGTVTLQPGANTGAHHHGRHEVAVYVVKGRSEIRWGERLEFAAEVGPGDVVYFAPYVPHQERNLSAGETVDFLVVRSDNERIAVSHDLAPVEQPETVF